MTGIIQNQGHKLVAINSVSDHTHILIGMRPNQSVSKLMEMVKSDSSGWINKQKISAAYFNWQLGYGAFAVSKSGIDPVIDYIYNQEQHHKKRTFREEYLDLLRENGVEYDDRYIFHDPE
jgi:REP element-mobilizing transposase RayT